MALVFLRSLSSRVLAIAVGFLFLSTTVLSQPLSERLRLRQREIVNVRFDSNFSISSAELQSVIATRPSSDVGIFPGFLNSFLGLKTEIVDESVQGYDTLVLQSYYKNNGFLQARVYFTLHENPKSSEEWQKVFDQNKVLPLEKRKPYPLVADTVAFHVKEGKPYTINLFTFEGSELLPTDLLDKVTKNISIKRGSKYSRKDLANEVKRVQDILTENGYAFFSVPRNWATIEMDTIRKTVNVSIVFNIGPRIKNGKVTILYDTAFSDRGQVRLTTVRDRVSLDSGQWFRASDLRATEDELFRLGTFEVVRIDLDTLKYANKLDSIAEGTTVPITIFLRMRSPLELVPGIFVGTSASKGQLVLGARLTAADKNIFGGAENLTGDGSWQGLPLDEVRWRGSLQLTFPSAIPPILGMSRSPLILTPSVTHSEIKDKYKEVTIDGQLGLNFLMSRGTIPRITFAPDGIFEYVERTVSDISIPTDKLKRPQFNALGDLNFTFDASNDFINPSKGYLGTISMQFGLPFIAKLFPTNLPTAGYLKNSFQFKTYLDPSDRGASIFAFRALGGWINLYNPNDTSEDITFERRFYGGGPNSMRGWPARTLIVSTDTTRDRPNFGGYKVFEANAEWRYALFQYASPISTIQQFLSDVRVSVFLDFGNVWDRPVDISLKTMALAGGFGFHYNTPFGAVRLDLGAKLFDPDPSTVHRIKNKDGVEEVYYYAISPSATGIWIWNRPPFRFWDVFDLEFAIGQAF